MIRNILLILVLFPVLTEPSWAQEGQPTPENSEIKTIDTLSTIQKTQDMIGIEEYLKYKDKGLAPDDVPPLLRALLLDASGDWDGAHRIAQADSSSDGSWVHAYLHREEGDLGNASYWYRSAGRSMPKISLDEEWEYIAMDLLKKS